MKFIRSDPKLKKHYRKNQFWFWKAIGDWGVYTADYVKSYFVDEYQSITQEQYEQIVAAKQ